MAEVASATSPLIEPQSARGRARLARMLHVATELFLRDGYELTSIDAILERSGGSKATLYAYFPTKEELFRAVVDSVVVNSHRTEVDWSAEARAVLTEFAVSRLRVMVSPEHCAILGLIVAERERFPDLVRIYDQRGPRRSQAQLVSYLESLCRSNQLDILDLEEAAEFFIGMLKQKFTPYVLFAAASMPSEDAIREHAERTVGRFLAAYRPSQH